MRLTELNPRWAMDADIVVGGQTRHDDDRHGMAITFDCPHCRTERLAVFFANPLDGKPPTDAPGYLWHREGSTFEDLTLTPSVDASDHGHWHGFIRNGDILQLVTTAAAKWIDVRERLPDLCHDWSGKKSDIVLVLCSGYSSPFFAQFTETGWTEARVMYWMPIPPAPETTP